GALCEAALQPLAWLGGAKHLPGSGCVAYGFAFEDPVHRLGLYTHKVAHGASVETLSQDAMRELESAEEAQRKAERAYTVAEVRAAYAKAVASLALDAALEKMLEHVESSIFHREEGEEEIEAEYELGRLYLVGVEERPILRGRAKAAQIRHLFCDVKDFTRRT